MAFGVSSVWSDCPDAYKPLYNTLKANTIDFQHNVIRREQAEGKQGGFVWEGRHRPLTHEGGGLWDAAAATREAVRLKRKQSQLFILRKKIAHHTI